jgi:hypothetical protein
MDKTETTEALAAIGMMLQAFPSAQSSITADSAKVYLFAVEEFSLDALKRACRAIVRGDVADLKPDFPPTAPKLAQIVKAFEDLIVVERFEAAHTFVIEGSETWRKLILLRGRTLPTTQRTMAGGRIVKGWSVAHEEAAKADLLTLPPPVSEQELAEINGRLAKLGITAGDPEDQADAA